MESSNAKCLASRKHDFILNVMRKTKKTKTLKRVAAELYLVEWSDVSELRTTVTMRQSVRALPSRSSFNRCLQEQSWGGRKPGPRNLVWIFHKGHKHPSMWLTTRYLLEHAWNLHPKQDRISSSGISICDMCSPFYALFSLSTTYIPMDSAGNINKHPLISWTDLEKQKGH